MLEVFGLTRTEERQLPRYREPCQHRPCTTPKGCHPCSAQVLPSLPSTSCSRSHAKSHPAAPFPSRGRHRPQGRTALLWGRLLPQRRIPDPTRSSLPGDTLVRPGGTGLWKISSPECSTSQAQEGIVVQDDPGDGENSQQGQDHHCTHDPNDVLWFCGEETQEASLSPGHGRMRNSQSK